MHNAIREASGVYYVAPDEALAPAPGDDFWYQPFGHSTASGVRVDETTAMNYSVCWAATRLLAGTTGWLPFNLYRKSGEGSEIVSKHPVHRIIHSQPNMDMGAMMFRARGVHHQVNWGNCYAEIRRTVGGFVAGLDPIHPSRIPAQNIKREDNGKLVYLVNDSGAGRPVRVKQEDMFHVPSIISEDGIVGKGVIAAAREAIGKAMGTQKRGAAAIQNGGAPPLALKGGKFKDKADREDYRKQINEVHSGAENAGKWLLLPPDSEVEKLGFSLEDSQFIESENFDIEEIARWYGVPPHLVGHLLRATFNNIEELGISFVKYSLIQWLKLWEVEVWRKLLTPREQEDHYAKFVVDALERGNKQSRTAALKDEFFNGKLTLNEWRALDDQNPIEGPEGDMHFVQQAMIPLEIAAKGPPEPQAPAPPAAEPPEDDSEDKTEAMFAKFGEMLTAHFHKTELAIAEVRATLAKPEPVIQTDDAALSQMRETQRQLAAAMLTDAMGKMLSVEINGVKRVAEKASKFDARLAEFYDKHLGTMERALRQPLAAWWSANDLEGSPASAAKLLASRHVADSQAILSGLTDCTADELAAKVGECVAAWHEDRINLDVPNGLTVSDELRLSFDMEKLGAVIVQGVTQALANQPAPIINVAPPVVNVSPPEVHVAAPVVNVPATPEYDIEPERDPVSGLTTRFRRVPKVM